MKISIIIPVYNSEKYLEKCLHSVVNQSYRDIEIICLNDGSKDNSLQILREFSKKDNRISVIDKVNEGAYEARKAGTVVAKGEYVTFIDSDDWVDKNYIKKLVEVVEKYHCDLVKVNCCRDFYREKRIVKLSSPYKENIYITKKEYSSLVYPYVFETYYFNSMCCQLIRRDKIKFIEDKCKIIMGEDLKFNLGLIDNVEDIYILNEYLYYYTYNDESVTIKTDIKTIMKRASDVIVAYKELLDYRLRWNLNNNYEDKIYSRILNEYILQISKIFVNGCTYKTFKTFFENDEVREIIEKVDIKTINKKYVKLLFKSKMFLYCYFKYVEMPKMFLKKMLKELFRIIINFKRKESI